MKMNFIEKCEFNEIIKQQPNLRLIVIISHIQIIVVIHSNKMK